MPPLDLYARVHFLKRHRTETAVQRAPGLPAPSLFRGGQTKMQTSGTIVPRDRKLTFSRHRPPCARLRTGADDPVFQRRQSFHREAAA